MRVSVVIPTFNRASLLAETIPALANQETGDFTYEVIFVSNGSSDNSDSVLKRAVEQYPDVFRYFYIAPTGGPSAPRNRGIGEATGDVVIIIDDDILPEKDFVLRHAEFHEKWPGDEEAALGEVFVPERFLGDPMSRFHVFPYDEVRRLQNLNWLYFWTCNVSFKRKFMLAAGMFDETWLYFEDIVCGHRLESHGMRLRFHPAAKAWHLHQMKPEHIPAKGVFTGRWLYALVERFPEPAVRQRFGILSKDLPPGFLLRRILFRTALAAGDNPATRAVMRMLGAEKSKRSRLTDIYFMMIFMTNLHAGYSRAKKEAKAGAAHALTDAGSQWSDRGEK